MNKCVIDRINNLGSFKLELHFHDGKVHAIDFSKLKLEPWVQKSNAPQ